MIDTMDRCGVRMLEYRAAMVAGGQHPHKSAALLPERDRVRENAIVERLSRHGAAAR